MQIVNKITIYCFILFGLLGIIISCTILNHEKGHPIYLNLNPNIKYNCIKPNKIYNSEIENKISIEINELRDKSTEELDVEIEEKVKMLTSISKYSQKDVFELFTYRLCELCNERDYTFDETNRFIIISKKAYSTQKMKYNIKKVDYMTRDKSWNDYINERDPKLNFLDLTCNKKICISFYNRDDGYYAIYYQKNNEYDEKLNFWIETYYKDKKIFFTNFHYLNDNINKLRGIYFKQPNKFDSIYFCYKINKTIKRIMIPQRQYEDCFWDCTE